MIAVLMFVLVGCSDTSVWDVGGAPPVRHTGLEFGQDTAAWDSAGDTGGGEEAPWRGQWAELSRAGDAVEGFSGFLDWDGAVVRCEVEMPVTGSVTAGCEGCEVGAALVYGPVQVVADVDGACAALGWDGLAGSAATFGHAAPSALWRLDGTWSEVGESAVSGAGWAFERQI